MKWSDFLSVVNDLLAVERRRVGIQTFLNRQVSIAVGDVQRLLPYYRTGITTVYEPDDLTRDGFASRGELPPGASVREVYHVKIGAKVVMRPMYLYDWSNRNDLRAGIVSTGPRHSYFRFAVNPINGRDIILYPLVSEGYQVAVVWDAIVGRGGVGSGPACEFRDNDDVPFDLPVANLVYLWCKAKLAREVDRNIPLAREFDREYRLAIASMHSEAEERLRIKTAGSEADRCTRSDAVETNVLSVIDMGIPGTLPVSISASGYPIDMTYEPQAEWVMLGDSGDRASIQQTIAVATGIKAIAPQFIVHVGDAVSGTTLRPGDVSSASVPVGSSSGGARHLIADLYLKHFWSYVESDLYHCFGDSDLAADYGASLASMLPATRDLIGSANIAAKRMWYEFARGPVRFFVLNSGINDSDPDAIVGYQKQFLADRVAVASEPWLVAVIHRPAYTSDSVSYPGSALVKTITDDLRALGVDLVVSAHARNYERFVDATGLQHVICGTGGAPLRGAKPLPVGETSLSLVGSQMFVSDTHGFLRFTADDNRLQWDFVRHDGTVIDRVTMRKLHDNEAAPGDVDVAGEPPVIGLHPTSREVSPGTSTTFVVSATGSPTLQYQWYKDGNPIAGAINASLTITGVDSGDAGGYTVHVVNGYGSAISMEATLTVSTQFTVYVGRSASATLDEAALEALPHWPRTTIAGYYSFVEGTGYAYFAFPISTSAASEISIPPLPLVLADSTQGYNEMEFGLPHALVTASGVTYRVYRSYYPLGGIMTVKVE